MAEVDNDLFWHPSLSVKCHQVCAPYPGPYLRNSIDITQTVCIEDHLYVAGKCVASSKTSRDQCRLFEYSLSLDTWDVFDTHVSEFALASYQSNLLLIGGKEHDFATLNQSTEKPGSHNKVWMLDEQYRLREADIPPMKSGRRFARALGLDKHLIVVGGDDAGTVEIYDGDTKEWSFGPSLPECIKESTGRRVQSIIHQDAYVYVQIGSDTTTSRVFQASVESIIDSSATSMDVSADKSSFWEEISCDFYVRSSIMLCLGYLAAIGSTAMFDLPGSSPERAVYVYKPSDSSCPAWLKVASVPMELFNCDTKTRIICVFKDHFLLLGDQRRGVGRNSKNTLLLLTFQATKLDLNQRFALSDLEKVEAGAKLPIRDTLKQHVIELKEETEPEKRCPFELRFVPEKKGDLPITVKIREWLESEQPRIQPTWKNLLLLLEKFEEKQFACQLELYLKSTSANNLPSDNQWERDVIKKLDAMKCSIEQLCEPNATSNDDQKLRECAALCGSVQKLFAEEHQKLEYEFQELAKEKENLSAKLVS